MKNIINYALEKLAMPNPRGLSQIGVTAEYINALLSRAGELPIPYTIEPGDVIQTGDSNYQRMDYGLPVPSDIWYLYQCGNILPEGKEESEAWINDSDGRLHDLFDDLDGIKPLRSLTSFTSMSEIENSAPYVIKEMRYEVPLIGQAFQYSSDDGYAGYAAYLAFPVGPLGVMEICALIHEDMEDLNDPDLLVTKGGDTNLLSPAIEAPGSCIGEHVIESAWKPTGGTVEYPAAEFTGLESAFPHYWLRYRVPNDHTWPIPGAFTAMLCRPLSFHAWWFQESCPFLYAGNWFETHYYTSGLVTAVTEPTGDETGNTYTVKVRGEEVELKSTDLYEYEVGDRVAVLKTVTRPDTTFTWQGLAEAGALVIIPVSFYEG